MKTAAQSDVPLDAKFTEMLVEARGSTNELRHLLSQLAGKDGAGSLMAEPVASRDETNASASPVAEGGDSLGHRVGIATKKWRSAEQQVADILSKQGWQVDDVSRQNVGYDLSVRKPDGSRLSVEVKSITRVGDEFSLTTNEEGVARLEGEQYSLALVHHDKNQLQVALITNPVEKLRLVRQCRQWVWLCSEYPFEPHSFPYE